MLQQINLYQPIFRKERKLLSAFALVQMLGATLLLLTVIAVYFQWGLHQLARSEQTLSAQTESLQGRIQSLRGDTDNPVLARLQARIETLEKSINAKQGLLDSMGSVTGAAREGFASYLEALSRQRLHGLWLTGVQLDSAGKEAQLSGVTLDAKLVPRYLQQLPRAQTLRDLKFNEVQLTREADDPQRLHFTLQAGATSDQEQL